MPTPRRAIRGFKRFDLLRLALVLVIVTATWLHHYRFFTAQQFSQPIDYWGDALFTAGVVKACEEGAYTPFLLKQVSTHGAPGTATWDDFPIPEQLQFWGTGVLARVVGLFAAINLAYLGAACLAAGVFYVVARRLRVRWWFAMATAALYGLSPFLFGRTVHHFNLLFYAHLPLVGLLALRLASRAGVPWAKRGHVLWVAVAAGLNNPYFLNFSLQLVVLGAFLGAMRRRGVKRAGSRMRTAAVWCVVAIGSAAALNAHVVIRAIQSGPNGQAMGRAPSDLERFALKPIELVLPSRPHVVPFVDAFAGRYESQQKVLQSERSYLGLGAAIALLMALGASLLTLGRRTTLAGDLGTFAAWLIAYSLPAGLNAVTGLLGITVFRSTNRASIVVATLALLALGRIVSARRWGRMELGAAVVTLALLPFFIAEQMFPRLDEGQIAQMHARAAADAALMQQLEARVGPGAMIFQLPVVGFPEESFEPFRPSLWTHGLRYSFGAMRGRPEAQVQSELAALPAQQLGPRLRSLGFKAIVVDGDASGLTQQLQQVGAAERLVSPDGSLQAIVLP